VIQEDGTAVSTRGPAAAPPFDDFFVAELPRLVALAWALVGDRAVAEELAQEAMIRAFEHWETVSTYDRPGAWARRVTINLASSTRRRRQVESRALERLERSGSATPAAEHEPGDRFWALVRGLAKRQREAVALFYLEDWSVREIAEFLGCTESTAKSHLRKGRRRLAAALAAEMDAREDA
jgi:RNA polymerase sigma-70 factor (ECF subfamily)